MLQSKDVNKEEYVTQNKRKKPECSEYIFCQLLTDPLVIFPAPLRLTRLFILGISHFFGDLGVVFYKTFFMKCQE